MEKLACIFLLVACLFSDKLTLAQDKADIQDNAEIFKTIAHMDSVLFGAFNNHDLATLQKVFAPNTEFYHDRDGLSHL